MNVFVIYRVCIVMNVFVIYRSILNVQGMYCLCIQGIHISPLLYIILK